MFSLTRDIFAHIILLTIFILIFKINVLNENLQHAVIIITPLFFIALHKLITQKFKKEFDNQAYFSAIIGVATYVALGSFSKDELISLGFKIPDTYSFFLFKVYFHAWAIVLLPIALKKVFRK